MTNEAQLEEEDSGELKLNTLPSEILFLIFDYCHAYDLVRLSAVCRRFYALTRDDVLWYRRSAKTLATNQVSQRFRSRCNPLINARFKWKVTHHWESGHYEKRILFSQNCKVMPWIQLTGDTFWYGGGNRLIGIPRNNLFKPQGDLFKADTGSDICKFIVRDKFVISGHRDGSVKFWLNKKSSQERSVYSSIVNAHSRDVESVEEYRGLVFTGSADGSVKAWKPELSNRQMPNDPLATYRCNDRIWSLALDPSGRNLAIGSAGNYDAPLRIFDSSLFEKFVPINHTWSQRGAGILDMVWENPQTLLTCGYDTCVRKWDLRTGKCVSHWTDPTDATIYCISSDYNYTMVTGTQFNCKTVLWDQRKPDYVQLYFIHLERMSSPVYSVSFDSCHLYGATDRTVVEVKFSGQSTFKNNYRAIMKYDSFPKRQS